MNQSLVELVHSDLIDLETAMEFSSDPAEFEQLLEKIQSKKMAVS